MGHIAGAADSLGFTGALVPSGIFCDDPWLVATAVAARTEHLKLLVATRPGLMSPLVVAQMAATFQRLSGDRLLLNIITGDAEELRRYGDWLPHDERYDRTGEFLDVLGRLWRGRPVDFTSDHFHVKAGLLTRPATRPEIHLGGSSEAARRTAALFADVYLTWGEHPPAVADLVADVRRQAAAAGRDVRVGTRFHVITRDTADEAWRVAQDLLAGMDEKAVARAQQRIAGSDSEGQRRMAALHGGRADNLEVYPNVWAGYGLVRPGPGVALVGSHEQVCERIMEYHALGVDDMILSGQPHLEEAYWFGEGVIPLLRARGIVGERGAQPAAGPVPAGERATAAV